MSLSLCIDALDWLGADCVSIGDTGGGVLGSSIPASGDNGAGYAYPMLEAGDMGKEVAGRIVSLPAGLELYAYEDTSFTASANDGTYVAYYQPYLDYVAFGDPLPISFTFGAVAGNAPGATLTGASSITGGAATAGASSNAPGATLTGTATITGGIATGGAAASAPGATLTGAASIIGGAASAGEAQEPGDGGAIINHTIYARLSSADTIITVSL